MKVATLYFRLLRSVEQFDAIIFFHHSTFGTLENTPVFHSQLKCLARGYAYKMVYINSSERCPYIVTRLPGTLAFKYDIYISDFALNSYSGRTNVLRVV